MFLFKNTRAHHHTKSLFRRNSNLNNKIVFEKRTISPLSYSNPKMAPTQYTTITEDDGFEKPLLDDRQYRFLKLNRNDLNVLVISDPSADKSAASLDVHVGSFADKKSGIAGLAHFCEHLLFMGTEKYPKENEYKQYLSEHSGNSNAYTAPEHTNYYFEVGANHLYGALDRFAQFFIGPLFSESCKDREILAVDSENKKNLQNDDWRFYQLDKSTSNPEHPFNGFSTGNYQTLHKDPIDRGVMVRDALIEFYNTHYSSNIMSLVILGKEDLETLSEWANSLFSPIPNKKAERPNYNGLSLYTSHELCKLIKAKPIMDKHRLELVFNIPDDQESLWDSKPSSYYSHLLGHESSGSILFNLKRKNWVNELSAGNMKVCAGSSLFIIDLELTTIGVENWKTIVVNIFEYLNLILNSNPEKWLWEEVANMSRINFKFKQKEAAASTVSKMSNSLYKFAEQSYIPPRYILSHSILRKFDQESLKEFGKYLNPNNFRITLSTQSIANFDLREKWYDTEYSYEEFPPDLKSKISNISLNEEFHIPKRNEFIPEDFTVYSQKSEIPIKHPYLIEDSEKHQVWYKQDDQFSVPKGTVEIMIHLPASNKNCITSVYSTIFSEILEDEMQDTLYYASLVKLSSSVNHFRDGINLQVSGYNDKIHVLLDEILKILVNLKPKRDTFDRVKQKMRQELKNHGYRVPYSQISTHFLTLVNEKTYNHEEKIKLLDEKANFEEFFVFATKEIWSQGIFVESLIHGNFPIERAHKIQSIIKEYVDQYSTIKEPPESTKLRTHVLSPGDDVRYELFMQDEDNVNSCIEYFLQTTTDLHDMKHRVLTDLLSTIIHEPCFDQLRTKEQLGYVVFSGTRVLRSSLGLRILIQSERSVEYLEYRINEFLKNFEFYIKNELSDEEFDKFKQALKDKKSAKLKNLSEEVNRFWNHILDGYYNFNERQKHVSILDSVSKVEFVSFYEKYISVSSPHSAKLVVDLKSHRIPTVSKGKRLQSSLSNGLFQYKVSQIPHLIESLSEKDIDDLDSIIEKIHGELLDSDKEKLPISFKKDLREFVHQEFKTPVPAEFPKGKLIKSIDEFRHNFSLGDHPKPIESLTNFYYKDQEQAHF